MQVKLLVEGGNMKPGPALSQKLGPAGVNINQVIKQVNESTKDFKGMKVPVELDIDMGTKGISVQVFSPPVSELLKKELSLEKGSGEPSKVKSANASIEQIISIAKTKLPNLLSKDLKAAVKSVIGTCGTLGILIEDKPHYEVQKEVDEGEYDKEIKEERTETSSEKKEELEGHFDEIKSDQEKEAEKEEEAEKAEEAKKAEETGKDEKTEDNQGAQKAKESSN